MESHSRAAPTPKLPVVIAMALFATVAIRTCIAEPASADGEPRSARELLSAFKKAKDDLESRIALVREAETAGADASRALAKQLRRELEPELARHSDRVAKAAKRALAKRKTRRSEIEKLRQQVASLSAEASLTKNAIIDRGDPAVQRLEELLTISRFDVVDPDAELAAARERLVALGELYDRLEASLAPTRSIAAGASPEPSRFDEILERAERLGTVLAMPISKGARRTLLDNAETAWDVDSGEALGVLDLNALRLLLGKNALRIDTKLCAAARDHSNDMREIGFFAHESPVEGKRSFSDRASRFGASARSENIANGQRQPSATNRQWFLSPGHHKNMLGNHGRIGLGRSGTHWTQLFG